MAVMACGCALALAVLAACLTVYAVGALAAELSFPALTGRVVDAAGILTPEQRGRSRRS